MSAKKTSSTKKATKSLGKKLSPEGLLKSLKKAQQELGHNSNSSPLEALRAAGVVSPIILLGFQHIRTRRTIDWIRENLCSAESASISSYFGAELTSKKSLENILSSLGNLSLFSKNELIVIYEADKVRSTTATTLAEAIKNSFDTALVILTSEVLNQKTTLLHSLAPHGTLVEFEELPPAKLRRWIQKEVERSAGPAGIEPQAIDVLIKYYGSDVSALSREINKLSLLTESGTNISRQLAEQISLKAPEVTSFQLINQIARKNAPASVTLARELIEQGFYPLQVTAFLSRCIRTLLSQKGECIDPSLAPELRNSWFLRNLGSAMRLFSLSELQHCLELLKNLDFQLKDSRLPDSLTLTLTVQRMALRRF